MDTQVALSLTCTTEPAAQTPMSVGTKRSLVCQLPATTQSVPLTPTATPAGAAFSNGDTANPYDIQFLGSPEISSGVIRQTFTSYKVGEHSLTKIKMKLNGVDYDVSPQSISVKTIIQTQQGQQQPTPYPIVDAQSVAAPLWWWIMWAVILTILAAYGIWEFLKWKKRKAKAQAQANIKQLTPKEKYIAQLRKLESSGYHNQAKFKTFALDMTSIIKKGISEQLKFPAEDLTTEELMETLRKKHSVFYQKAGDRLTAIFTDLDQIKFAKTETTTERCLVLLDQAYRVGQDLYGAVP